MFLDTYRMLMEHNSRNRLPHHLHHSWKIIPKNYKSCIIICNIFLVINNKGSEGDKNIIISHNMEEVEILTSPPNGT